MFRGMVASAQPVGTLLREWRQRRHMSQLELACEASVSSRHVSFLETGRAMPSREMVLQLAEQLEIPLRERNMLLVAAGFAPMFPERDLNDPALDAARKAIEQVLAAQEPYPCLAIDRHWNLLSANQALLRLLSGIPANQLKPPVNVLRLSLHPEGLAPRIVNLVEWRRHVLARLRRQVEISADPELIALLKELSRMGTRPDDSRGSSGSDLAVPFQLSVGDRTLSLISTTTIFGTAIDITLSEIAIESFFPADAGTATVLREMADSAVSRT